ncbi:hypothetical protein DFJ73DRAFT_861209 [Zopfochytrium polystomum]|nr:hypothetical protein DFJ73DRAFT_861209 [Zopfochytrium polystomum]
MMAVKQPHLLVLFLFLFGAAASGSSPAPRPKLLSALLTDVDAESSSFTTVGHSSLSRRVLPDESNVQTGSGSSTPAPGGDVQGTGGTSTTSTGDVEAGTNSANSQGSRSMMFGNSVVGGISNAAERLVTSSVQSSLNAAAEGVASGGMLPAGLGFLAGCAGGACGVGLSEGRAALNAPPGKRLPAFVKRAKEHITKDPVSLAGKVVTAVAASALMQAGGQVIADYGPYTNTATTVVKSAVNSALDGNGRAHAIMNGLAEAGNAYIQGIQPKDDPLANSAGKELAGGSFTGAVDGAVQVCQMFSDLSAPKTRRSVASGSLYRRDKGCKRPSAAPRGKSKGPVPAADAAKIFGKKNAKSNSAKSGGDVGGLARGAGMARSAGAKAKKNGRAGSSASKRSPSASSGKRGGPGRSTKAASASKPASSRKVKKAGTNQLMIKGKGSKRSIATPGPKAASSSRGAGGKAGASGKSVKAASPRKAAAKAPPPATKKSPSALNKSTAPPKQVKAVGKLSKTTPTQTLGKTKPSAPAKGKSRS